MPSTIFFSWQSDIKTVVGRNLVERALKEAANRIGDDTTIEPAIRDLSIDRDTLGVPGSPPIADTIFQKIDNAVVFVPDLSFVGRRIDGRPTPNPNVLIEYGWASKALGNSRIVPVMNTAFGVPGADTLPFNLRHLRHPITYHCPPEADEETRKRARERLSKELERAIRSVFTSAGSKGASGGPTRSAFLARSPPRTPGSVSSAGRKIGSFRQDRGRCLT